MALSENLYAQFVPESQRRALPKMSAMVEGPHVKADCAGEYQRCCYAAAVADGELASSELFWSRLEPKSGGETS